MENKRQISHVEKFQITYIAAAPARSWIVNARSLSVVYIQWLPSKEQCGKGGQQSDFTVEKCDKHYLCHVLKVNINSDKSCWLYVSLI